MKGSINSWSFEGCEDGAMREDECRSRSCWLVRAISCARGRDQVACSSTWSWLSLTSSGSFSSSSSSSLKRSRGGSVGMTGS